MLAHGAAADSYAQPHDLKSRSADGQFEARTTPGNGDKTARLSVHRAAGGAALWSAQLTNPVSPSDLAIASTGNHVITFDNWARNGYGDDVIAFYKSGSLIKKYSLEQILGVEKIAFDHPVVAHTVSSRLWRHNAIELIDQLDSSNRNGPDYVIWLASTDQWLAWSMDSGETLTAPDEQVRRWENAARIQVINKLRADRAEEIALQFLAKLRRPKDRRILEKRLQSIEFIHGSAITRSSDGNDRFIELVSHSPFRQAADSALARWDNQPPSDHGHLLGELHGTLQLPAIDSPDPAIMHIYLIPESIMRDNWTGAALTCRIGRKLDPSSKELSGNRLDFRFRHVTPGRYWIKAVYDTARPFAKEDSISAADAGDYESVPSALLEVSAAQTTESAPISLEARSR